MRWLFNPITITSDGYVSYGHGRDQGGNLQVNFFTYSPAINFPKGIISIETDEHNHWTRQHLEEVEIKFTIYSSYSQGLSFGSFTINYIPNFVSSINSSDANLSDNSGYPNNAGTYYLQFLSSDIIRRLNNNGIYEDESGNTLTVNTLNSYPIHMEFVCRAIGCKYDADVITTTVDINSATYNAGYYYIPITRPNRDTSYSSVRARAAIRPNCPYSIMELIRYSDGIVYTSSTDANASTGAVNNLVYELNLGDTKYIKLSYSHIQTLIPQLQMLCPDKIDTYGLAIQIQLFWHRSGDINASLGDLQDVHSLVTTDSSGYTYKHDISLYQGTTPIHKRNQPKINIKWSNILQRKIGASWNPSDWQNYEDRQLHIGIAIRNSVEYDRTLKYIDHNTKKERKCRGRIRPRDCIVWLDSIDIADGSYFSTDMGQNFFDYIEGKRKLTYWYNLGSPYFYIRPVIGYSRQDCAEGGVYIHWLRASDEYIRFDAF